MTNMVETTRFVLKSHIKELGCAILLKTKCKEIRNQEVVVEGPAGEKIIPAGTVVIATKTDRTISLLMRSEIFVLRSMLSATPAKWAASWKRCARVMWPENKFK